jgi:hypothetical protein
MIGLVGVTAMDTSVAEVTLSLIHPEMAPHVTLMVVSPAPLAITVICPGALTDAAAIPAELIVATLSSVENHVADVVRSFVVLSE